MNIRCVRAAAVLAAFSALAASAQTPRAKNVILMISDGAGDTTWKAANQWQFGTATGHQQWENNPAFVSHWVTTFPGDTLPFPPGQAEQRVNAALGATVFPPGSLPRRLPQLWNQLPIPQLGSYDPIRANDNSPFPTRVWANSSGSLLGNRGPRVTLTPVASNPIPVQQLAIALRNEVRAHQDDGGFAAYDYLIWNSNTDSAAAGTAIASGRKAYNSAINFIDTGSALQPVPFITQEIKRLGKRAGVVTTKPFTDATPAVFGTQNDYRDDEAEISNDMIYNGLLDVIITPGHPEFGGSQTTLSLPNLAALRAGVDGWTFVDNNSTLLAIADATQPAPQRLFGMVPVGGSLNSRDTTGRTNAFDPRLHTPGNVPPGVVPFTAPDLPDLALAAIRSLSQDPDGFFVMIEGASVDSAAHANNLPQLVEEQLAFNRAVDRVIQWIETESSWDETLLIITTDHANALFLGPQSDTIYFQDPIPTGVGQLPQGIFWTTQHTNELVPLWARGPGADAFATLVDGIDPRRGPYIDNTDIHTVMSQVINCPCDADVNGSGSPIPDIDDVVAFFADYNIGSDRADLNCTGPGSVPDIDDVTLFFDIFNNGCN